mgnify:FL=1
MDLKECQFMDDRKEILTWVFSVIKGLETTWRVSNDDFSFIESRGWRCVIDLDLIKKHL